jgi:aminotransferase
MIPELSNKMGKIDSSPIRKAFELASTLPNPINLSIGQPHFPCPQNIIEAMNRAAFEGKTSYTLSAGIPELREAIAEKYTSFNKIPNVVKENVLITSGVSSALFLLFNAYIDPGDIVLIISPYFLMYPSMLKFYGANVMTIEENFQREDLSVFKSKKIKFILFSNPSNPSGKILNKAQLEALAELSNSTGATIISDEIYELFDYDNKFYSIASFHKNTITLSGFSKTYNMTGLRLASVLADKEIISSLTKLQQYTVVCAPSITQYAGIEALKTDMTSYIDDYRKKRDYVYNELKDSYEINNSDGAFYFFIKLNERDIDFTNRAVTEHQLIVVPGFIFHPDNHFIRISFATEWDILKKGINALKMMA